MDNTNIALKSYLGFSIVLIALFSVLPYPTVQGYLLANYLNVTVVWWAIITLIYFLIFYCLKYYYSKKNNNSILPVKLFLIWNIVSIIHGTFWAETYWDWKMLVGNTFAFLLPLLAYIATNERSVQWMLIYFFKIGLLLFFTFILFTIGKGAWGFYLAPVSFIMLFFPVLENRWKIIIAIITFIVVTVDISVRSNVIKYSFPVLIMSLLYFRNYYNIKHLNYLRWFLFITPLLLFLLGVSGIFNVFKFDNYIKGKGITVEQTDGLGVKTENNIKDDTRTFIYEEVIYSANVFDSWLIGRSPARGNISETFGSDDLNKRNERYSNEIAIANIFTWNGIIGVILYFFVFFRASFLAINRSNNIFVKLLGLFMAFRWVYAWVEDVNNFSITYLMIWIMLGLCYSVSFRKMSDKEVVIWVRGIFNAKYRQLNCYK